MVRLAQTMHQPRSSVRCIQDNFWAYGTFDQNRASILCQDKHYLQTDWIELSLEPHHQGVPSRASKTISEPIVRLAQIVQLSCVKIITNSKRNEMTIHLSLVT
jgi:hypothetical protein